MTNIEATEIIQAIAEADYGTVEPHDCTTANVRAWLGRALRPGYSSIDDVPTAIETLGMDRAIAVYIEQIATCHECEYSDDDSE